MESKNRRKFYLSITQINTNLKTVKIDKYNYEYNSVPVSMNIIFFFYDFEFVTDVFTKHFEGFMCFNFEIRITNKLYRLFKLL